MRDPDRFDPTIPLRQAVLGMVRDPLALLRGWNWKAAMFSAMIRSIIFLTTNLHAGHARALRAMLVELSFSVFAAGTAGAVTQRLRHAVPRAATAVVVWLGIPGILMAIQLTVHAINHTPHVRTGVIASFIFAAFATGFNWFVMSRGVFVTGENRSFFRDLLLVPQMIAQFVIAPVHVLRTAGHDAELGRR
jgi:hypothetical protein